MQREFLPIFFNVPIFIRDYSSKLFVQSDFRDNFINRNERVEYCAIKSRKLFLNCVTRTRRIMIWRRYAREKGWMIEHTGMRQDHKSPTDNRVH